MQMSRLTKERGEIGTSGLMPTTMRSVSLSKLPRMTERKISATQGDDRVHYTWYTMAKQITNTPLNQVTQAVPSQLWKCEPETAVFGKT